MGVVFRAQDERLGRQVALKMIRNPGEESLRDRFWREARIAAQVNHPNVCQIYEVNEHAGELYLVMELLVGPSLSARIKQGPLTAEEAGAILTQTLAALSELHARNLVHRDVKPANLIFTAHGVKLLDFGLARGDANAGDGLSISGMVVGTPAYMSPEQAEGRTATNRSDLFAAGALLYELLAGKKAFGGSTLPEILHAVVSKHPPALAGSSVIVALDRVIQKALAKDPSQRFASAADMSASIQEALASGDNKATAQSMQRLIVLPFRILRPDPEIDFLSISLPDAIASAMASCPNLIVRSSLTAYGAESHGIRKIAEEAAVDLVLTGSVLRAGGRLRVATQLVQASDSAILHSQTTDGDLNDIFLLQDSVAEKVASSLSLPDALPSCSKPEASAYELYLRGNEHYNHFSRMDDARVLYERCVETDPKFAPAWARLGRAYRICVKFGSGPEEFFRKSEHALQRALEIDPDLGMAHNHLAQLEADTGRARQAMVRLLRQAHKRGNDPEIYAGLVTTLRYCGLTAPSIAAHNRARRMDPSIKTSVAHSYFMLGDYEAVVKEPDLTGYLDLISRAMLGRTEEAIALGRRHLDASSQPMSRRFLQVALDTIERKGPEVSSYNDLMSMMRDPEGIFYWTRHLARENRVDLAIHHLGDLIDSGYYCVEPLTNDPWLEMVRQHPEFPEILALAVEHREQARREFQAEGGENLLGVAG
jgi:serine/threonine-protein kinase